MPIRDIIRIIQSLGRGGGGGVGCRILGIRRFSGRMEGGFVVANIV